MNIESDYFRNGILEASFRTRLSIPERGSHNAIELLPAPAASVLPSEEKAIEVTVGGSDSGAEISVHNYGSVIAPDEQAHLFAPFTRTRKARNKGQSGWGLGLTLVRGAAERIPLRPIFGNVARHGDGGLKYYTTGFNLT